MLWNLVLWIISWMVGVVVYGSCGFWMGRLSWRVFDRMYKRAERQSPNFGERLLECVLFPATSFSLSSSLSSLMVYECSEDQYVSVMALLWPFKVLWNVPCLLICAPLFGMAWLAKRTIVCPARRVMGRWSKVR